MAITTDISRKLPIGVQSFSDLRKTGCLYVDKTDYVYYLAHSGTKSYFLARPRRFGKSLFANTLSAYFEGRKECFSGLKIESPRPNQRKGLRRTFQDGRTEIV